MEPRYRRFQYVYSPCYLSRPIDILIHRWFPAFVRAFGRLLERTPPTWDERIAYWWATYLERTSPRWGWIAQMSGKES